jgi:hypothetical protein
MKMIIRTGLVILFFTWSDLGSFAQSGIITTVAGNGTAGYSGDGGLAISASMGNASALEIDSAGNLYIAEYARIRKVTKAGIISTVAGNGVIGFSGDGGPATAAKLNGASGVAVDSAGNLYIADGGNNRIRRVSTSGVITTIAGTGVMGFSGDRGPAILAQLNGVRGLTFDSSGTLFFIDNNRIRKIANGTISTIAGNGGFGSSGDGGPATSAPLGNPYDVAADIFGNIYIAELDNRVRKVSPSGIISTLAGDGTSSSSGDGGRATSAQVNWPKGVAVDATGNIYIAETGSNRVRKVTAEGIISTVAGNGQRGTNGDGGPAISAQIYPQALEVDSSGNVYIADEACVRKVTFTDSSVDAFFPQVAIGGGYTTLFGITNSGATAASANLSLTDQHGNPLSASFTLNASGNSLPSAIDADFAFSIPSGGTIFLTAAESTPGSSVQIGWAQLRSKGGSLAAVASYEYLVGGQVQTIVGVLQSPTLQYATIQVDNNTSQGKQTACAIANPGSQTITIKLALVDQAGVVVDDTVTIKVSSKEQIATYLYQVYQDISRTNFRGTLVLRGQGANFVIVALSEKQGIMTAIPVISGKAPGIPN